MAKRLQHFEFESDRIAREQREQQQETDERLRHNDGSARQETDDKQQERLYEQFKPKDPDDEYDIPPFDFS